MWYTYIHEGKPLTLCVCVCYKKRRGRRKSPRLPELGDFYGVPNRYRRQQAEGTSENSGTGVKA